MNSLIPAYKHFYQRVEFYILVALPWLGFLIDMLNNEIRHGSADFGSFFPLLAKIVTFLTAVYGIGMGIERSAVANNLTPNNQGVVAPDGSTVQS